jgi:hypothetical protein
MGHYVHEFIELHATRGSKKEEIAFSKAITPESNPHFPQAAASNQTFSSSRHKRIPPRCMSSSKPSRIYPTTAFTASLIFCIFSGVST